MQLSVKADASKNPPTYRGAKMKSLLIVTASAVGLLTVPGAAYSQDAQQPPLSTSNQSSAQQGAAPTEVQMRDSSGGGSPMPGTKSGERSPYGTLLTVGLSCDIYRGS